jgi:hypothetical protein
MAPRKVFLKLGISPRKELADALGNREPQQLTPLTPVFGLDQGLRRGRRRGPWRIMSPTPTRSI